MFLTEEERKKFVLYCLEEAASYRSLAEQAEKLGPGGRAMATRNKNLALAYSIVARHNENVESVSIGKNSE